MCSLNKNSAAFMCVNNLSIHWRPGDLTWLWQESLLAMMSLCGLATLTVKAQLTFIDYFTGGCMQCSVDNRENLIVLTMDARK